MDQVTSRMEERRRIHRGELAFGRHCFVAGQRPEALIDEKTDRIGSGCANPVVPTPVTHHRGFG